MTTEQCGSCRIVSNQPTHSLYLWPSARVLRSKVRDVDMLVAVTHSLNKKGKCLPEPGARELPFQPDRSPCGRLLGQWKIHLATSRVTQYF